MHAYELFVYCTHFTVAPNGGRAGLQLMQTKDQIYRLTQRILHPV